MQVSTANFTAPAGKPSPKRKKAILLLALGSLQVAAGALVAVAPHLATIVGPRPFAVTMIVTGVGSAVLAFVTTQLKGGSDE